MTFSSKDEFTFTWKIENYSFRPQNVREFISSPSFAVDAFEKTEWHLKLFPRGNSWKYNNLSCFLCKSVSDGYLGGITFSFTLTVGVVDSSKEITLGFMSKTFKSGDNAGFFLSDRDNIFTDEDAILPNDTLTIQCYMRKSDGKLRVKSSAYYSLDLHQDIISTTPSKEIIATRTRYKSSEFTKQLGANAEISITRIPVISKTGFFKIKRFKWPPVDKEFSIHLLSVKEISSLITFRIFRENIRDQYAQIDIRRKVPSFISLSIRGKIRVAGDMCQAEDRHYFASKSEDYVWRFPDFIKLSELWKTDYLGKTGGILYLNYDFSFSARLTKCDCGFPDYPPTSYPVDDISIINSSREDLVTIYAGEKLSDGSPRAPEIRSFKAHRSVLSATSPTFRAMFEADMKEKETGIVHIQDLDADTVDGILCFIYTDTLGDSKQGDVAKLYYASDKYQLLRLNQKCRCVLSSTLSVTNVYQLLILADTHQDDRLLDTVRDFILSNADRIIHSAQWNDFIESNPRLAADLSIVIPPST